MVADMLGLPNPLIFRCSFPVQAAPRSVALERMRRKWLRPHLGYQRRTWAVVPGIQRRRARRSPPAEQRALQLQRIPKVLRVVPMASRGVGGKVGNRSAGSPSVDCPTVRSRVSKSAGRARKSRREVTRGKENLGGGISPEMLLKRRETHGAMPSGWGSHLAT